MKLSFLRDILNDTHPFVLVLRPCKVQTQVLTQEAQTKLKKEQPNIMRRKPVTVRVGSEEGGEGVA